ncbi:MAG TPA: hypothetical protein VK590_16045 [Saprospiraceae bacterium]|nr:hypothetical protein [Saprospiraceae bacterium]
MDCINFLRQQEIYGMKARIFSRAISFGKTKKQAFDIVDEVIYQANTEYVLEEPSKKLIDKITDECCRNFKIVSYLLQS